MRAKAAYGYSMMPVSENIRGAMFMVGAMTAYTINDAMMKAIFETVPLFQSIFLRGVLVVVIMTLWMVIKGQLHFRYSARDWALNLLRALTEVGGAIFFLTSISQMPFANATAILQSLPLTVSLAAAVFLSAPIGWYRIVAILFGFVGVLFIVQPGGAGFNSYSFYALAAVMCVTARDLIIRKISSDMPSMLMAWVTAVAVMAAAGFGSMTETWGPIPKDAFWQLVAAVLAIIGGYVFSVSATRQGDIAFVAPFRYTGLLAAVIIGTVFFDEWPDTLTWIGSIIVVLTGLFTFYRESRTETALEKPLK